MLLCSLAPPVSSSPLCSGPVCPVASLASLFDRVIQHSARMHAVSTGLHQHAEQQVAPSRNHIGRANRNCHTSSIVTPNDKENAQRMTREELTEVILKLLVAWRGPLWHLEQSLRPQSLLSSERAAQVGRMVHEVRSGVQRVAQKMQTLGMMGNFVSGLSSPESSSESSEWLQLQNSDLLLCFRRDANKVQNYLKILKCRTAPEYGC
ncbi:hypothetical protein NL108_018101 [Boleophthalmus pectinirostris]|nr:hypothetical protein NL108_018101 [Boleophthalmus pectinirostris]